MAKKKKVKKRAKKKVKKVNGVSTKGMSRRLRNILSNRVRRRIKIGKFGVSKYPWFKEDKSRNIFLKWLPLNWKGWIALAVLFFLYLFSAQYFDIFRTDFDGVSKFLVVALLSLFVFIVIAKRKTKVLK